QWRKPLRHSLDWLRDRLADIYETIGGELFTDVWAARDEYVEVICDRSARNINQFFNRHQTHKLTSAEKVDALRLLEMQRHALLMYTSCGWFFEEISRPEGTQILRYAGRAIELAEEVSGQGLEAGFLERLAHAPSNIAHFKNGAGIYRDLVLPSRIALEKVAAHYALSSLFNTYHTEQQLYCYTIHQKDYHRQTLGALTLAVGQVQIISNITQEKLNLTFAVLHLGGWDFHCGIQAFKSRPAYARAKESVLQAFGHVSVAQTIVAINNAFGEQTFSLQNLFAEERHRIMRLLSQDTLQRLDQLYTQIYRENYGILMAFHRDRISVPQELQVAAEIALSHRALDTIRHLEVDLGDVTENVLDISTSYIAELEGIALEASHFNCQLKLPGAKETLEQLIVQALRQTLQASEPKVVASAVTGINRLITLGDKLQLGLSLDRAQETYYHYLHTDFIAQEQPPEVAQNLLQIGQQLAVCSVPMTVH
ncbi:MAG: DUF3536 domain-containing protein, partial [Cyanobacteria bacterium P01_D01_bin.44]